jgi:predicted extracellular nuclease
MKKKLLNRFLRSISRFSKPSDSTNTKSKVHRAQALAQDKKWMIKSFGTAIFLFVILFTVRLLPPSSALTNGGSITLFGSPLTENFDSLASAGTNIAWADNTTIAGLFSTRTTYNAGTGSSNTGALYSFGVAGTNPLTDRALGSVASGGTGTFYFAVKLTNNTGSPIASLSINYVGEQWRDGGAATPVAQTLNFQHQVANAGVITDADTPSTGWTAFSSLSFTSPTFTNTGAGVLLDGNAAANRTAKSATLTFGTPVANGQEIWLRWQDINDGGNDHGLAIDDLSITANGAVTMPNLSINDVSLNEGNAGTTSFTFTVNLSAPAGPGGVTFDIATADGTAQDDNPVAEDNDYVAKSLTGQTIPAGSSTYSFTVDVNGDTTPETNETFFVNVTNVTGANVTDGQGQGTIQNDDAAPNLTINDVPMNEGNAGTTTFTFTVSLSAPAGPGGVTFDIATADGTAQDDNPVAEDNDYVAKSLTGQTIPAGSSTYTFDVLVNGDTAPELNETFFVNVTNVTNAIAVDSQGQGTILNEDFTSIHDIQGNGAASPIPGATVTTTGIVTLLKTGSNAGGGAASGFFLQTPDAQADADPNTSQGIFVFTSSVPTYTSSGTPVAVGDELSVTGTVVEFNGMTEISPPTNLTLIDTGNTLPTAVTLTAADLPSNAMPTQPQLEKYEGMRLSAASLLTVVPNDNFFDVETVLSGVPRQQVFREPGIDISDPVPPDPTSGVPDPNVPRWDENPERLKIDTNGRAGAPNTPYTSNVTLSNVTGPLDFAFGEYRLTPEAALVASANMSAVPVPVPLANEYTIVGYNIENFNNNATQREKVSLTFRTVLHYPDIVGVAEIFDLADLQALRDEINNDAVAAGDPNPMYEAYLVESDGTTGDDDQDVGFLVKTSRVSVTSVTQVELAGCDGMAANCNTYIDPNNGLPALLNDRPPLVLDAVINSVCAQPQRVLVIVNHLRSFIDIEGDTTEGRRVRAKRKAQAEFLAGLLQELQTNNPTTPVISVGDYNAFQFSDGYTDPISVIKGNPTPDDQIVVDQSPDLVNPNFINLIDELPADQKYTFIFEGTPQVLDHVLINTVAQARNTRIAVARNNADFPDSPPSAFESNIARPERNSDHDMPVAYFSLIGALLSPTIEAFPATGGQGAFSIDVVASCPWTAVSNDPWIIIVSENSGVGDAKIAYEVRDNFNGAFRRGSITVAGETFTITQNGGQTCSYSLLSSGASFGSAGGSGNVGVMATAGCTWEATSTASWITITSGSPGSGGGIVSYSVAPNTGAARSGKLIIAGRTFTVKQKGTS